MRGWYGNKQAHSLASRGISTIERRKERDEWRKAWEILLSDSNINNLSKESYDNISDVLLDGSRYGIYDTASHDAMVDYVYDMLKINIDKLSNKPYKMQMKDLIKKNTNRDGDFNPFNIFTDREVSEYYIKKFKQSKEEVETMNEYNKQYSGWKGVTKNIQKVIDKETEKIAKEFLKERKYEEIRPIDIKILTYKMTYR